MGTLAGARSRLLRLLLVGALAAAAWLAAGQHAHAACHAFTVEATPSTADEGTTVTLTIRRDADVNPSSVRVRTVDETATGGSDYTPLDERVEFDSGTEQQREVPILDDDEPEDTETFQVELSEGEGCTVNPNFTYESTTVSITDDDPAAQPSPSPSPDAEPTPEATTQEDTGDLPRTGSGAGAILAGLALLAGAGLVVRGRGA